MLLEGKADGDEDPDSVLAIRRGMGQTEWNKLSEEEQGYFNALSDAQKQQREVIKRGDQADPAQYVFSFAYTTAA